MPKVMKNLLVAMRYKGVFIIYGEGGGGGLANGRGGKRSLLLYLGGVRKVLLWIWVRGGGGGGAQKSLKVGIISFGVFLNSSRTARHLMYLYHSKSNHKIQQC